MKRFLMYMSVIFGFLSLIFTGFLLFTLFHLEGIGQYVVWFVGLIVAGLGYMYGALLGYLSKKIK